MNWITTTRRLEIGGILGIAVVELPRYGLRVERIVQLAAAEAYSVVAIPAGAP